MVQQKCRAIMLKKAENKRIAIFENNFHAEKSRFRGKIFARYRGTLTFRKNENVYRKQKSANKRLITFFQFVYMIMNCISLSCWRALLAAHPRPFLRNHAARANVSRRV